MKACYDFVVDIMNISIRIGEYDVTFMQLFLYFSLLSILLKFVFGLFGGKDG